MVLTLLKPIKHKSGIFTLVGLKIILDFLIHSMIFIFRKLNYKFEINLLAFITFLSLLCLIGFSKDEIIFRHIYIYIFYLWM